MGNIRLLLVFIIAFFIIFPSTLSAELSTAQFEIIRVAFMNGYSTAIKADMDTIKALKEDQVKLKRSAQLAVNGYMEKVSVLNGGGMIAKNKDKKVISSSNSMSL
jgi:hypothetical protein